MEVSASMSAEQIWGNGVIPVCVRQIDQVKVRLPYHEKNREFIKSIQRRKKITYDRDHKCWCVPKTRFNELVSLLLNRFDSVYVIQPYSEQEKCAPACWNATGHFCQCSCLGKNHGSHQSKAGWFIVSEACAIRNRLGLAYKLLTRRSIKSDGKGRSKETAC